MPNVWGMIAGDGNCDSQVTWDDIITLWSGMAGETQYHQADYNLDGVIDNKDKNDLVFPNQGSTGQSLLD